MATILVPTDFSKNADNALKYAINLAKKKKAKIILLHSFQSTYVTPEVPAEYVLEQLEAEEEASIKQLKAIAEKVTKAGKIKCSYISKQGFAVDVIIDTVKNKKIDLVVMGTKGAGGLKETFIGSNTAVVIEKSPVPVIAVPEKASFENIKNILYATDYRITDVFALKNLAKIAKMFNAKIEVVHISDGEYVKQGEQELLNEFIKKTGSKIKYKKVTYHLLYGGSVEKKLQEYVKKRSINLLAMSTHPRNFIDKLFGKSVTKKMVYHTNVPLMAFHYRKDPIIFT